MTKDQYRETPQGAIETDTESWTMLFATANGGRIDGKEQTEAQTDAEVCSEAPEP
jgi:hypothetical protein